MFNVKQTEMIFQTLASVKYLELYNYCVNCIVHMCMYYSVVCNHVISRIT